MVRTYNKPQLNEGTKQYLKIGFHSCARCWFMIRLCGRIDSRCCAVQAVCYRQMAIRRNESTSSCCTRPLKQMRPQEDKEFERTKTPDQAIRLNPGFLIISACSKKQALLNLEGNWNSKGYAYSAAVLLTRDKFR